MCIHRNCRSDHDDDDDDNNSVMQGLQAEVFLMLCITKGERRRRKRELVFIFFSFFATMHKIEEKNEERIEKKISTYVCACVCIYAFLGRYKEVCVRVYNSLAISWYL